MPITNSCLNREPAVSGTPPTAAGSVSVRSRLATTILVACMTALSQPTLSAGKKAPAAAGPAAPAPAEAGVWIDDSGQGAVEIAPCAAKLCGTVVWLREPTTANGGPVVDDLNPNKALRTQPVCGLQVIGDLAQQKDGTWDAGWVYDPKTGDRFDVAIKLKNADTLSVTGYLGVKFLGETFTWRRAPAATPLPRCNTQTASPAAPPAR